jgi:hypothetical protein
LSTVSRFVVELIALCAAVVFCIVARRTVSNDADVAFFIAIIGAIAVWEAVRFVLLRRGERLNSGRPLQIRRSEPERDQLADPVLLDA